MVWMGAGITMQTNMKRGGSSFIATYTSNAHGQEISLATRFPGEIRCLDIGEDAVIVQKGAFLAAQPSVRLSEHVSMHMGGENAKNNFIFQRLSGEGIAFIAIGGGLIERILSAGEMIKADIANVALFEESISFQTAIISDFQNTVSGGEGLIFAMLTGPGKVWLQTLPASI